MWSDSFDPVVMSMSRWVRSATALAVVVMLVAALAAIATIHTAGLSRADVCTDAGGQQFEAVGGCTEPGAAAPFALPPPEFVPPPFALPAALPVPKYVAPQRENVLLPPRPEIIKHPATGSPWSTTDQSGQLPWGNAGLFGGIRYEVGTYMSDGFPIYGL